MKPNSPKPTVSQSQDNELCQEPADAKSPNAEPVSNYQGPISTNLQESQNLMTPRDPDNPQQGNPDHLIGSQQPEDIDLGDPDNPQQVNPDHLIEPPTS